MSDHSNVFNYQFKVSLKQILLIDQLIPTVRDSKIYHNNCSSKLQIIFNKLGYPCLACVQLFLFLFLYVSFFLSLSLWRKKFNFDYCPPSPHPHPPPPKKVLSELNLTPAEEENAKKNNGLLLTFGDWTFIQVDKQFRTLGKSRSNLSAEVLSDSESIYIYISITSTITFNFVFTQIKLDCSS